jgi:hypothetical protein
MDTGVLQVASEATHSISRIACEVNENGFVAQLGGPFGTEDGDDDVRIRIDPDAKY